MGNSVELGFVKGGHLYLSVWLGSACATPCICVSECVDAHGYACMKERRCVFVLVCPCADMWKGRESIYMYICMCV